MKSFVKWVQLLLQELCLGAVCVSLIQSYVLMVSSLELLLQTGKVQSCISSASFYEKKKKYIYQWELFKRTVLVFIRYNSFLPRIHLLYLCSGIELLSLKTCRLMKLLLK